MRLFLLQPTTGRAKACIQEWQRLHQVPDITVLMADSAQEFSIDLKQNIGQLYCLELEYALLNPALKSMVKVINYDDFLNLINTAKQVLSLR